MKINTVKGIEISALSLGTVQLGLSYGINNADGKPSQETANAILNAAIDGGINPGHRRCLRRFRSSHRQLAEDHRPRKAPLYCYQSSSPGAQLSGCTAQGSVY